MAVRLACTRGKPAIRLEYLGDLLYLAARVRSASDDKTHRQKILTSTKLRLEKRSSAAVQCLQWQIVLKISKIERPGISRPSIAKRHYCRKPRRVDTKTGGRFARNDEASHRQRKGTPFCRRALAFAGGRVRGEH